MESSGSSEITAIKEFLGDIPVQFEPECLQETACRRWWRTDRCTRRPPPSPAPPPPKSAILGRQNAGANDVGDHMRPIAGPRLQANIFNVAFHRTGRDVQFHCHFLGRKTKCDKAEHFGLPVGQFNRRCCVSIRHGYPQICALPDIRNLSQTKENTPRQMKCWFAQNRKSKVSCSQRFT